MSKDKEAFNKLDMVDLLEILLARAEEHANEINMIEEQIVIYGHIIREYDERRNKIRYVLSKIKSDDVISSKEQVDIFEKIFDENYRNYDNMIDIVKSGMDNLIELSLKSQESIEGIMGSLKEHENELGIKVELVAIEESIDEDPYEDVPKDYSMLN